MLQGASGISQRDSKLIGLLYRETFASFFENDDKFRDEFIRLRLAFSLPWQDTMVILAHCGTLDEKECSLKKTREHINGLQDTHPHHQIDQMGGDATPEHDPH